MKINKKHALKYLRLLICLMAFTSVVVCQQLVKPITKDNLISSIRLGRRERKTAARYIELINRYGVAFSLAPEDEKEIRRTGKYLGRTGLKNLIAAIRNNYRPNTTRPPELATQQKQELPDLKTNGQPTDRDNNSRASPPSSANQNIKIISTNCSLEMGDPNTLMFPASLTIGGLGWNGESDIKVIVNGQDVSMHIDTQYEHIISLVGTNKELNLRDGKNEVTIIVNGITSNTYVFRKAIK